MRFSPSGSPVAGAWQMVDTVALTGVTAVAGVLRFLGIGSPKELVFDEFYYVPDACRFVIQLPDLCGPREFTFVHPPAGKWLIAFGMQIVGPTRYGWRLMPAIVGILTCVLVFLLARALLTSTGAAALVGGAFALDPLHLVHSRVALLDVFLVFFTVASILFAILDRDDLRPGMILRPWRIAAGLVAGLAVATKWSGVFALLTVVILLRLWDRQRTDISRAQSLASIALCLVAVPLLAYLVSYADRFDGSLLALPWQPHSWINDFLVRQADMLAYHTTLREQATFSAHEYSSPAWSWMLMRRPVNYYFSFDGPIYRQILATGNPAAWWPGIVALGFLCVRAFRRGDPAASVILLGFVLAYAPWFFLTFGNQDPYLFYLLPSLPFLYLALGYAAREVWRVRFGPAAVVSLAVAIVAGFVFLYPVLTYRPLTPDQWHARLLFEDCHPLSEELADAVLLPTRTAPMSWCWI